MEARRAMECEPVPQLGCRLASRIAIALQPLQIGAQFGSALVAQLAVFLQRLVDDALQFIGKLGIQTHRAMLELCAGWRRR